MSYLDKDGVLYLWGKIRALFNKGITGLSVNGKTITYTKGDGTTGTITTQDTNTTYSNMTGATASADGKSGLVPAPSKGAQGQFLRGDGTWQTPANTTYSDMKGATTTAAGTHGLAPAPAAGAANRYLRSDGTWSVPPDNNTTYSDFKGATDNAAGSHGLVPAPAAGDGSGDLNRTVLLADGTWKKIGIASTNDDEIVALILDIDDSHAVDKLILTGATDLEAGIMTASDKRKLNALPTNAELSIKYATKSEIANMYKYKGSVADASKLPTSGNTTGDVYNIEAAGIYGGAGMNVAWNGSAWDPLGEVFTITAITNAELDTICS